VIVSQSRHENFSRFIAKGAAPYSFVAAKGRDRAGHATRELLRPNQRSISHLFRANGSTLRNESGWVTNSTTARCILEAVIDCGSRPPIPCLTSGCGLLGVA
jgi:hypothetical protein